VKKLRKRERRKRKECGRTLYLYQAVKRASFIRRFKDRAKTQWNTSSICTRVRRQPPGGAVCDVTTAVTYNGGNNTGAWDTERGIKVASLSDPRCLGLELKGPALPVWMLFVLAVSFVSRGQFLFLVKNDLTASSPIVWASP
jgi:hypothetical protein